MADQVAALAEITLLPLEQVILQAHLHRKEATAARHQHLPQITAQAVVAVRLLLVQMEPARLAAMAVQERHRLFLVAASHMLVVAVEVFI
jgi:hypothetical protein